MRCFFYITPEVEDFYKEWSKPETPNIATAESTKRNKPLTAVVLFTGCKVDGANCNIRVDFIVLKPDGSNYGSQKDVAAWVKKPGAPKGVIQVSEASLRIVIERNDPAGKYIVKAIVRASLGSPAFVRPLAAASRRSLALPARVPCHFKRGFLFYVLNTNDDQ